ncbi:MAG: 6-bladed beta-propeller [Tannerella sp.]|nr:6-bladed beta-propeller [Tannerella sp.]
MYFIFLAVLCFSCNKDEESNTVFFNYSENVSLPEMLSDVDIIKLETSDSCQIAVIKQMIIHKEKIFVLNFPVGKNILVFDMKGKFLHSTGSTGQGPGEYILPHSISIRDDMLYVKDVAQNKIILFDCNTYEFIREEACEIDATYFSVSINNRAYLWSNTLEIHSKKETYPFHLTVTDKNYNVQYTAAPMKVQTGYLTRWSSPFTHGERTSYFVHPYQNEVYEIAADTCMLKYTVNFEGFLFPPTDYLETNVRSDMFPKIIRESDYINQFTFFETDRYIVSNFFAKGDYYLGIFNKNRQEGICFNMKNVTGDVHAGCYDNPQTVDRDVFYSIIYAGKLAENKEKGQVPDIILNRMGDINEDDNPVILKYKIKF